MMIWSWNLTCTYSWWLLKHITALLTPTLKTRITGFKLRMWELKYKGTELQQRTKKRGLFSHILGTSNLWNGTKWKPRSGIRHQIPSHGYLLTEGPQLTFMKLFYKHVSNRDQASTLNEKYEVYLNSMRGIINTNTHKTKSTNYNKVLVLVGTITVYCNPVGT